MTDMLNAALGYARMGWPVFPLHTPRGGSSCSCSKAEACDRRGKHPRTPNGLQDASTDEATIRAWWARWPDANVGVRTGNGLVVIDVDSADPAEVEATMPPTRRVHTGRGRHYYFRGDAKSGQNVYGQGVDVRGAGGYVVAPPSLHASGSRYEWDPSCELVADLPDLGPKKTRRGRPARAATTDTPLLDPGRQRKARARAWLAKREPAVEGQGGSTHTLTTAIEVLAFVQGDVATAIELLQSWNATCQPPWPPDKLARKVDEALKSDVYPELAARREQELTELGAAEGDSRPVIQIGVRVDLMAAAASAALRSDPETYQRSGELVHVARVDADADPDARRARGRRVHIPTGTPVIRPMGRAKLRSRMSCLVNWQRLSKKGGELEAARPDEAAIAAVHEAGEWPGVRVLVGISETPLVRLDGAIVQEAGYDAETRYLYAPGADYPRVAERPTQADAAAALGELVSVWSDVPWGREVHRYVPVAAVLTLLARPAIAGAVPLFTIDKSTRGSGGTLVANTIAAIATGRTASHTTYSDDDAETRKVLDGYAIQGARLVVLDNVATSLGGAALDAYVTARDSVDVRVLGSTGQRGMPWRGVIIATGNNIEPRGDTIRRVLATRIEPREERPEDRTGFAHPDLVAWVQEERPRLVSAALTMLRAYVGANRPDLHTGTWGGFEAWSALVPQVIAYAGGPNVLTARIAADAGVDRDAVALDAVLDAVARLDPDGRGISVRDILARLYPDGRPRPAGSAPDGLDAARDAFEHLAPGRPGLAPSAEAVGKKLRGARGRWVRGRRLEATTSRTKVNLWRVEGAGDAGDRGGCSNPSRARFLDLDPVGTGAGGNGGREELEHPPRSPASPAPPSLEDLYEATERRALQGAA